MVTRMCSGEFQRPMTIVVPWSDAAFGQQARELVCSRSNSRQVTSSVVALMRHEDDGRLVRVLLGQFRDPLAERWR